MIKRIVSIAILGAIIGCTGCSSNSGQFIKEHGIEYKIVTHGNGKKAQMGDILQFNFVAKVDTQEIENTYKMGRPGGGRVDSVKRSGDLQAIFPYLREGDSAIVHIACDSILKNFPPDAANRLPAWMKKGKTIVVNMKVVAVQTQEEYQKDMQQKQAEMMKKMQDEEAQQAPIDDKMLQDYLAKNNIKATKTESGLYYEISKEGKGEKAKAGQMVSMNYTGKTLDGKTFDSNTDTAFKHTQPFTFKLGQGQVIKGWDEGVQLLNKGAKAVFYIPSRLAYGPQQQRNIPANSILVFNVEVLDIKDAPEPGAPGAAAMPKPKAVAPKVGSGNPTK